jgi:arylsulfatase
VRLRLDGAFELGPLATADGDVALGLGASDPEAALTLSPAASLLLERVRAVLPELPAAGALGKILLVISIFLISTIAKGQDKPNILVIMGDDIGWFNTSAYNSGMMGYTTPNIDRIARDGIRFTDAYGQQSCTAGRAAFITGQSPKRTGLLKIGMPGDPIGLQPEDPTIAELLKPLGYATGQFGKNHLGDLDEHLPTNHGFDEFFGNLYHLNAEEEPENSDYPKDPAFRNKYGPRGVIRSTADGKIEDTGPLTKKRMETVDEEFLTAAIDFMERQHAADKPWFAWFNTTRMHIFTHLKEESDGATGLGLVADGMREHDNMVGQLLDKLDELGVADNTIVIYTTDNGAEKFTWPDGGTSPFRGEKATTTRWLKVRCWPWLCARQCATAARSWCWIPARSNSPVMLSICHCRRSDCPSL